MIAEVLVDIRSKEVDRLFDYKVPTNLQQVIEIGQRVTVPFGPRFIMGYVLGFKEESSFARVREIQDVLDLIPTLTNELIELGRELSVKNTIPLVSIYQAMLPQALKSKYTKKLICEDVGILPLDLAVKFNKNHECIYNEELKPYLKQIKQALTNDEMHIKYEIKQALNEKYIKRIKLIDGSIPLRGKKQIEVVEYLTGALDCLKTELMDNVVVTASTINTLVKKGVIEEYKLEMYREIESLYEIVDKTVTLNEKQVEVFNHINSKLNKEEVYLLHGVTGSGKTEIYLNIIEEVLNKGREAIMLVPEISLTPMMVTRFKGRFGDDVALLHSRLSIGEKYDEWRKIRRKEVKVVVGARSAIFAPFTNLGIIIIDEEHTDTYKQDTNPRYHAKEVALSRIKNYQIPLILGSATPSIESYYKALNNEFTLLELPYRANKASLPRVYIEDMRDEFSYGNLSIFSRRLKEAISDRLDRKEQVILLLNRRGHSTFVMCRSCGEVIMCPNCDISLTYHENTNQLVCHYCGHKEHNPTVCPYCSSKHIRYMGIGTEKVEELVKKSFPDASVVRMDADTTKGKNAHEKLLYQFEHSGDILIGTQMIAKGLDFKKVSLVGVLAADMSLNLPDYSAVEKTFQLLTQVSGRAGRHDIEGEVVIQTYNPDHYAISNAKNHDYHQFYNTEMEIRKIAGYTPIKDLVQIILMDKDVSKVLKLGTKIVIDLRRNTTKGTQVLGPVLPKVARINNYYRAQIIIKHQKDPMLEKTLKKIYNEYSEDVSISIDHHPHLL
jgi:primosomal protein N' (replication factor Y)